MSRKGTEWYSHSVTPKGKALHPALSTSSCSATACKSKSWHPKKAAQGGGGRITIPGGVPAMQRYGTEGHGGWAWWEGLELGLVISEVFSKVHETDYYTKASNGRVSTHRAVRADCSQALLTQGGINGRGSHGFPAVQKRYFFLLLQRVNNGQVSHFSIRSPPK